MHTEREREREMCTPTYRLKYKHKKETMACVFVPRAYQIVLSRVIKIINTVILITELLFLAKF